MRTWWGSLILGLFMALRSGQTVSAVSLTVRPNLQQFFSKDVLYMSCDQGGQRIRRTTGGQTEPWTAQRQTGLSPSDSGLYWCETSDGRTSESVNITVVPPDCPLILEIPALPVMTGGTVTFLCRTKDGSRTAAFFFRNSTDIGGRTVHQQVTLGHIQPSDEGFYSCSTNLLGSSLKSWLRVQGHAPSTAPPPLSPSTPPLLPSVSVFRLFSHLVVVCLFCISSVMMVLICSMTTGKKSPVSMETTHYLTEHNHVAVGGGAIIENEF
ncbi:uncharacterized protein LOC112487864 isoform X1 [Cynoglossus semilaevis]|uniref:uncharacterized protein LOC112487864 isoform X1 n=1 Tax=Cynoglossus semilaevis TaxID=244447 RepID=UPI000D6302DF|nr:uncharacterized protein LOC112487864 isoform X1 [Cynoglossus semilaevis]